MARPGSVLSAIGWAGADALGRLMLLSGATIIFSRLLDPADFGVSAIVLATAAAAGLLVGAPFQDALTQRHVLRKAHLQSALGFSLIVALAMIALSLLVGPLMAGAYDAPEIAYLLPVTMLTILFSGHGELVGARARRTKRFSELARASLIGNLLAAMLSVAAAFLGAGVWSLILLRLISVLVQSVVLQVRVGFPVQPRLSAPHLADLRRMASIASLDRITDNLTYLAFNTLVGSFFGLAVLGHVNMAMRIVEPVRGAVLATLHNLTFPHFRRMALSKADPAERNGLIRVLATLTVPIFIGLACVTPWLMPILTGPGWDETIPIALCLAVGAALAMAGQPIFTALLAGGAPEYGLFGSIARFLTTMLALVLLRDSPPLAVGLARLFGDGATAMVALFVPLRRYHWTALQRLGLLLPAWANSAAMAAVTVAVMMWIEPLGVWAQLAVGIATGIATQVVLLRLLQKPILEQVLGALRPARRG